MSINIENSLPRIVVLGSGNVATALSKAIEASSSGVIVQVYSRQLSHAAKLADSLEEAIPTDSPESIVDDADIYIVSLADDAVTSTLSFIKPNDALWLHTSGSLGMEVLSGMSNRYGVFYPLQTFSLSRPVDLSKVTLFTEGSTPEVEQEIRNFGNKIFKKIIHADSETRSRMHIAAVFACNFSNYLWTIAYDILKTHDIPFDVLEPLLKETLDKALTIPPRDGQTGPARRGDTRIIEAHSAALPERERKLYQLISNYIMEDFHGE